MGELSAVAVLVLGLLHEQPMHPYQMHQNLVERGDARLVRISLGAVYHGVERLERDGLVGVVGTDRTGNRPERTTYRITETGQAAFARRLTSFLGDDHPTYPLFSVGLAEATDLPRDVVTAQLERRRAREAGRLADLESAYERIRAQGLPRRYVLDVEHDLHLMRAELAWLDGALAEIRDGSFLWGEPIPAAFVEAYRAARRHAPQAEADDLTAAL
ncbi:PadR family transcriptional regulator [Cellulomonas chitinilytica]|uniref:PadR family transcriptional regulator n=1 Tax=Cellulomonas chitinilytica TaxID=398759 RepID=UPI00194241D5|nr:PadR family transcriptional regulator [Cellulomonas chitinilytica]